MMSAVFHWCFLLITVEIVYMKTADSLVFGKAPYPHPIPNVLNVTMIVISIIIMNHSNIYSHE